MNANRKIDGFEAGTFPASNGYLLRYRLYTPDLQPGVRYPLILHFHGAGSWGDNNEMQLRQAVRLVKKEYPAYILAPKTIVPMKWVDVNWNEVDHVQPEKPAPSLFAACEFLLKLIRENSATIDPDRIYVNGQSMGGYAAWDIITRYPETFAAAVPVCGGGDASKMNRIKDLPLWVFHGAKDLAVPVANSRHLLDALEKAGNHRVKYTEYPEVEHNAWDPAYEDPALFQWLFSQTKQPCKEGFSR